MTYFAARSLRGVRNAPAEDGAATPVLRPRLPSRYETMPPEPGAASEIAGEDAFFEAEPLPHRRAPATEPSPSAAPAKFATSVPAVAALAPQAAAMSPHRIVGPPAPAVQPSRADQERRPDRPASPLFQPGAATAIAIAAPPPRPRPIPNAAPPPLGAEPRSDAAAGRRPPSLTQAETGDAPDRRPDRTPIGSFAPAPSPRFAPMPAAVAEPLSESRLASVPMAPPTLSDAPRPPPAPPREAVIDRPPAAPRVEITIGRIEIRAASIPAPPRAAPRAPPMSLDDYLAKRGRG